MASDDGEANTAEATIFQQDVDPSDGEPNYQVLQAVAEVEGVDVTELPSMYERIDHMLDELFSEPPTAEAQVEITFSYHGYRITADQEGQITLRKLDTSVDSIE
jgi:hypothetical protein